MRSANREEVDQAARIRKACCEERPRFRDTGIKIANGMVCIPPSVSEITHNRDVLKWFGGSGTLCIRGA